MKYSIITVINGNYKIHAEGITDLASAKTQFHGVCQTLWSASDVETAYVMLSDEQLDAVDGYKEYIHHDPQPETVEEPAEE
jgi:hypothetical protein